MAALLPRNDIEEALYQGHCVLCVDGELVATFTSFGPYVEPPHDPGYTARYLEAVPRMVERTK